MFSFTSSTTRTSAIAAAACLAMQLITSASAVASPQLFTTPTAIPVMNALTPVGCFSRPDPMVNHGNHTFQSKGNCQPICYGLNAPVMGLVNGTNCYCGNLIPPNSTQVDQSKCDTPCGGIDTEKCGGANYWQVYLTGITRNHIQNLDAASLTASTSAATKTATSSTGPATVVVTASAAASKSSGTSTVGVAVGVVVGLIALAGLALGVWFLLRHKRRRDAEEEYKRNAAINSFVHAGKGGGSARHGSNSTVGDSRLDPELLAARRESNGSINDTADYSRRILQVRNPDGGF